MISPSNASDGGGLHPLLHPELRSRYPREARFWFGIYRRIRHSDAEGERIQRDFLSPVIGGGSPLIHEIAWCFDDADCYVDDLLHFVSPSVAAACRTLPRTREASHFTTLLRLAFEGAGRRERFEARRKLYLATMLFDIDHTRAVRDGPSHRAALERLLQESLFANIVADQTVDLCLPRSPADSDARDDADNAGAAAPDTWCFRVRTIRDENTPIELFDFRLRFKRDGRVSVRASDGSAFRIGELDSWPTLQRRSGSILSKMIRRGIGDSHAVKDLLGAMFVVRTRRQAYTLEERLLAALGGPLRWRERIDTLERPAMTTGLNATASEAFEVLKVIVDVLVADPGANAPYHFPVEIQIHLLEPYLQSLSRAASTNHHEYKRRQFLSEIRPAIFPASVYPEASAMFLHP